MIIRLTGVVVCAVCWIGCASTLAQETEAPAVAATTIVTPTPPASAADTLATRYPVAVDPYPAVTGVRLGGDEHQTRVVFNLSRGLAARVFTLADPYRLVVDLPQVNFQLPARAGETGQGLIKAFRFGQMMKGGSRVVLDLAGPVRVEKSSVLDAAGDQPTRLVLELAAIGREPFLHAIALDNRLDPNRDASRKIERDVAQPSDDLRPVVVLDPGHGGIDEGAHTPAGEAEKTVVLDFALMLRDKIERIGKYRVEMTRSDDTFVALADRVQIARARRAQLFISLHCDALARGEGDAQGATVYTLSDDASDAEAARLAETENRADIIAGVDLSREANAIADILIDLAQRETRAFSAHFAWGVVDDLKNSVRLHKPPLKSAGFRVLKAPDVPSVLIELGFVSNRADFKQMTSETWRSQATDSVAHAVDAYFATRMAASPRTGRPE
ncbi:MAG TPA: N-acetylmuramoyl-L-alanine amidase [Xanthobacteraceae bacterium]|nr:N-acetylmuramoyl-L-alanine amidase [Xanthobacteraceae bacterium]